MARLSLKPYGQSESAWLCRLLSRNANTKYLREFGSPPGVASYREQVPLISYEDLKQAWLPQMTAGESDVLFSGRPLAYEMTGGSSGGTKLIPYSREGLLDFQAAIGPWLENVVATSNITGAVYLATSPATRPSRLINGVPVGLPDGAYLGEHWGSWIANHSAIPLTLMAEPDIEIWRAETLRHLRQASSLELISVWSPTFFLRLLEELPMAEALWPNLKVISCWASAESAAFAYELQARLPHAQLQPKGLLSTECVVTVPNEQHQTELTQHGFFEFESDGRVYLKEQLDKGCTYEVIATTASGLYRYRTGDLVLCDGYAQSGQPILDFLGRSGISSDLVGEKLTDAFVSGALRAIAGFRFLTCLREQRAYALVTEFGVPVDLASVEQFLCANPQYAYARALGQLAPLMHVPIRDLYQRYEAIQIGKGVRLADVKCVSLIPHCPWIF